MIEVHNIRILHAHPGRAATWMVDIRLINPEQGKSISEYGFEVWNYDKAMTVEGDDLDELLDLVGEAITEVLCHD